MHVFLFIFKIFSIDKLNEPTNIFMCLISRYGYAFLLTYIHFSRFLSLLYINEVEFVNMQ